MLVICRHRANWPAVRRRSQAVRKYTLTLYVHSAAGVLARLVRCPGHSSLVPHRGKRSGRSSARSPTTARCAACECVGADGMTGSPSGCRPAFVPRHVPRAERLQVRGDGQSSALLPAACPGVTTQAVAIRIEPRACADRCGRAPLLPGALVTARPLSLGP
jgi:hypothetical protein